MTNHERAVKTYQELQRRKQEKAGEGRRRLKFLRITVTVTFMTVFLEANTERRWKDKCLKSY